MATTPCGGASMTNSKMGWLALSAMLALVVVMLASSFSLAQVHPLNAKGQPDPNGRIVLLSIGMSNTTQEFSRFKQMADADPDKNPRVTIVDGAQGGQDATAIRNPNA